MKARHEGCSTPEKRRKLVRTPQVSSHGRYRKDKSSRVGRVLLLWQFFSWTRAQCFLAFVTKQHAVKTGPNQFEEFLVEPVCIAQKYSARTRTVENQLACMEAFARSQQLYVCITVRPHFSKDLHTKTRNAPGYVWTSFTAEQTNQRFAQQE